MVTVVPTGPEAGLKDVITGGGVGSVTVKEFAVFVVCPYVVTEIILFVAPEGTITVNWVTVAVRIVA